MAVSSTPISRWYDQGSYTTTDELHTTPAAHDTKAEIVAIHYVAYGIIAKVIVAVGIFGNILNLIVLTRPKLKGVMYTYLLGLAVSNLCVLVSAIPALHFLAHGKTTQYYIVAFFNAHLAVPVLNTFMAASVYIMICTTVNRYISIYMPTHFQRYHTYKNAYIAIGLSFLGGIVLHIPLCFDSRVTGCTEVQALSNDANQIAASPVNCVYSIEDNLEISDNMWYKAYIGVSETLLRLGPILTLTVLNIMIIIKFCRIAKKRQILRGTVAHPRSRENTAGTTSTVIPPPTAILAARDKQNPISIFQFTKTLNVDKSTAGNFPSISQSHDIDTNTLGTIESNDCPATETSPLNRKPVLTEVKITTTDDEDVDNGIGNENKSGGDDLESGNSSRRESPPQNQSFQSLLVVTRPRGMSNSSRGDLSPVFPFRGTPCRVSRRRGLHNPEERMLVLVLLAIVILFVICTTPATILSLLFTNKSLVDKVGFSYFRACANNLELLGFALNFFVYCFCSAEIRRAFVEVLIKNWIVQKLREKLLGVKDENPDADANIDVPVEDVGDRQVRPVVASANLMVNPSITCVHNNEIIVVNIPDKQVNNNSNGNVAV